MSRLRMKWINCTVSLHAKKKQFVLWLHLTFFLSSSNEDIIQELREEIKALESYLDSANEEIQVLVLVNRI